MLSNSCFFYDQNVDNDNAIKNFLDSVLFIPTNIDEEIKTVIKKNETDTGLFKGLLKICFANAQPYVMHPILYKFKYATYTDITPKYYAQLAEHLLISAAYSLECMASSSVSRSQIMAALAKKQDKQGKKPTSPNMYLYQQSKTMLENSAFSFWSRDSLLNKEATPPAKDGETPYIPFKLFEPIKPAPLNASRSTDTDDADLKPDNSKIFRPLSIDLDIVYNFVKNTAHDPYNRKYCVSAYDYARLSKFINNFNHITLNNSTGFNIGHPGPNIMFNNFVLERLSNFYFISFLVQAANNNNDKMAHFPSSPYNSPEQIAAALVDFAALPNVFSRVSFAKSIVQLLGTQYGHSYNLWRNDIKVFIAFLSKCSIPVLSLYFQFILSRYSSIVDGNGSAKQTKKNEPDVLTIQAKLREYIKKIQFRPKYNLYTTHTYTKGNKTLSKVIAKNSVPPPTHSNIEDHYGLCEAASRRIFHNIMSPASYQTNIVNCTNFFSEQEINMRRNLVIEKLMSSEHSNFF